MPPHDSAILRATIYGRTIPPNYTSRTSGLVVLFDYMAHYKDLLIRPSHDR